MEFGACLVGAFRLRGLWSKHCWFKPVCASSPAVFLVRRAFIVSVVDHSYMVTLLLLWPTMSSYPSTTLAVPAQEPGNCDVARVDPTEQELGNCDVARVDPTEQELGNCDVARVDPTEQELGNCNAARVDPTEQELGNCNVVRVDPTE
ncbi:hypothetical protein BHM03_00050941 [Ensete ventricosum]|nr:hypothetical protein BHM03_00050941 [Ensete ventricosum]